MAFRRALLAAALLLPASLAFAQEEPEVDCENQNTQMEMNVCAANDYADADKDLNDAYRQAMTAAHEMDERVKDMGENYVGAVEALKKAQRSWIGYRDGQCELSGFAARGGSMEPMLVSNCLASLTRTRTEELKSVTSEF